MRESQNVDELYYLCRIGDFLLNNKLYQEYYNFIRICVNQSPQIIRDHINDENSFERLKLFENLILSNFECFAYETYTLLYNNLTINLYAKSKVKTPELIEKEYYEIYKKKLYLFPF